MSMLQDDFLVLEKSKSKAAGEGARPTQRKGLTTED
jgi:hypothetical protein